MITTETTLHNTCLAYTPQKNHGSKVVHATSLDSCFSDSSLCLLKVAFVVLEYENKWKALCNLYVTLMFSFTSQHVLPTGNISLKFLASLFCWCKTLLTPKSFFLRANTMQCACLHFKQDKATQKTGLSEACRFSCVWNTLEVLFQAVIRHDILYEMSYHGTATVFSQRPPQIHFQTDCYQRSFLPIASTLLKILDDIWVIISLWNKVFSNTFIIVV